VFASLWIRKKMTIAVKEIRAERALLQGDEELQMLTPNVQGFGSSDTSYHNGAITTPHPYRSPIGTAV
jgi:hypothetical protein